MLKKINIIAWYTFKEIIKSKVLYTTIFLGLVLIAITYVATEFTYGVPEKVALDFGLGMLSFSSLGISLFMGATLLSSEIDSRTVYMVISRPVPRWVFISGKILGLIFVLAVNIAILSLMMIACSTFLGGEMNQAIFMAILFNLLECILLLLVVVFFSIFTNNILASVISLIMLLLGHAVHVTQSVAFVQNRDLFKLALKFYHWFLPGFYKLNLKDFVIYQQKIETSYLVNSFLYGTSYSLFLFFLIIFIFNKKNLD